MRKSRAASRSLTLISTSDGPSTTDSPARNSTSIRYLPIGTFIVYPPFVAVVVSTLAPVVTSTAVTLRADSGALDVSARTTPEMVPVLSGGFSPLPRTGPRGAHEPKMRIRSRIAPASVGPGGCEERGSAAFRGIQHVMQLARRDVQHGGAGSHRSAGRRDSRLNLR